jgi:hypothetical protein
LDEKQKYAGPRTNQFSSISLFPDSLSIFITRKFDKDPLKIMEESLRGEDLNREDMLLRYRFVSPELSPNDAYHC